MPIILPTDINTIINYKIALLIAEHNYDICADIRELRLRFYINPKMIRDELVDIPFILNFRSLKQQRQKSRKGHTPLCQSPPSFRTFTKRIIFVDEPEDSTPFDISVLRILTNEELVDDTMPINISDSDSGLITSNYDYLNEVD